jgi:DNA-directed RNA polymerase sigma subunit (sigma70/sigma32)
MQNKQNTIDFQAFFTDLLSQLSEREQEVLKKRYQLTSDVEAKNTLKKIGDSYGITRERVRQIEREAIDKLVKTSKASPYDEQFKVLIDALVHYLERKGGVATEEDLVAEHILDHLSI